MLRTQNAVRGLAGKVGGVQRRGTGEEGRDTLISRSRVLHAVYTSRSMGDVGSTTSSGWIAPPVAHPGPGTRGHFVGGDSTTRYWWS